MAVDLAPISPLDLLVEDEVSRARQGIRGKRTKLREASELDRVLLASRFLPWLVANRNASMLFIDLRKPYLPSLQTGGLALVVDGVTCMARLHAMTVCLCRCSLNKRREGRRGKCLWRWDSRITTTFPEFQKLPFLVTGKAAAGLRTGP